MWARLIVILLMICFGALGVSAQSDFLPRGWDSFTTSFGYYGNSNVGGLTTMANLGFNGVVDARVGAIYYLSGAANTGAFSTSITWYPIKLNSPSSLTVGLTTGFQSVRSNEYVTVGAGLTGVMLSGSSPAVVLRVGLARAMMVSSFDGHSPGHDETFAEAGFGLVFGKGRSRVRLDLETTWFAGDPVYGLSLSLIRCKKHDKRTYPKI